MQVLVCALALWLLSASGMFGSSCQLLESGHEATGIISGGLSPCYLVSLMEGERAFLTVEQPRDLEFQIKGSGHARVVDAFESGTETATIDAPGEYRVEVRPVIERGQGSVRFVIGRKTIPLQSAAARREAEESGTQAKHAPGKESFAAALRAWQRVGDQSAIGRSHIYQGENAAAAGNLTEARNSLETAIDVCTAARELECAAIAANDSGTVSWRLGDFEPSLVRLNEAASYFGRTGTREMEGVALSNLGLLMRHTGDYQRAIAYYDRAGNILRQLNSVEYARVLNNLGVCYQSLAEYERARSYFGRALQEFTAGHSPREAARARLNLGRTWFLEGKNGSARKLLLEALAEATENADRIARAGALRNLGQLLIADKDVEEAKKDLRQALELDRALKARGDEAIDLEYLGEAARLSGDKGAARESLNQALAIMHASGLRDAESDALFALANLNAEEGEVQAAREYGQKALNLLELVRAQVPGPALRASFYARKRRVFDLLIGLEMRPETSDAVERGFLTAERGHARALIDVLADGELLPDLPGDVMERRKKVQRRLDLLALRISAAPLAPEKELRGQFEALVAEQEEIGANVRLTYAKPQLETVQDLEQKYLPPGSALLEYFLGETGSYLWLVDQHGIRAFHLQPRVEIEAECANVTRLYPDVQERKRSPEKQRQFERALRKLSATLIGPVSALSLPDQVIIVPDGILTTIPFAALELSTNRRLGLEHDLVQLPSAAYLVVGRNPRPVADFPKSILALADPVFSSEDPRVTNKSAAVGNADLPRIPYNEELNPVIALVSPSRRRILRGFDATAKALETLPLKDYALIHLSTHALIDDRTPELSRVTLSMLTPAGRAVNGFVRPQQLARLRLDGSTVVLSACDTALGKQVLGEGLAGFTTSLFSAGAARLVLTLSVVDAEGSSEFFRNVYRNVFSRQPLDIEHAITLARRAMARSKRWSDPIYWASFMLYGAPSGMENR